MNGGGSGGGIEFEAGEEVGGDAGGGPSAVLGEPGEERRQAGGEGDPGFRTLEADAPDGEAGGLGTVEKGRGFGRIDEFDGDKGAGRKADQNPGLDGEGFGVDAGAELDGGGGIEAEQGQDGGGVAEAAEEPGEPAGILLGAAPAEEVGGPGGGAVHLRQVRKVAPEAAVLDVN